jgi:hypothetical protein
MLLAQRISEAAAAGAADGAGAGGAGAGADGGGAAAGGWAPVTPLGRSLAAVREPSELSRK